MPGDVEPAVFDYIFQVLFCMHFTEWHCTVGTLSQFISICSLLSKDSQNKLCTYLDEKHTYYGDYLSIIRYQIKNFQKPFTLIDSQNCSLWHYLLNNSKIPCGDWKRLCT